MLFDKPRPTLVFEANASEPHENIVEDARQWLLSGGKEQRVVLIDIQEDRRAKDFQDRFCRLVLNYAQEDAIGKLGIQDDFGEVYGYFSDSELENYLDLQNYLVHVDVIASIDVTPQL